MRVLLFSGGLDSTALAHWLRPDKLLFIDYGQICALGEQRAATQVAKELGLSLDARTVDCRSLGSGDMAGRPSLSPGASEFWPYRNQLLITLGAMMYAGFAPLTILIGTVQTDSVHVDGKPDFLAKAQELLRVQGVAQIEAPAIGLTSDQLLEKSQVASDVLAWTFSCHRGNDACGQCRGCQKHFATIS